MISGAQNHQRVLAWADFQLARKTNSRITLAGGFTLFMIIFTSISQVFMVRLLFQDTEARHKDSWRFGVVYVVLLLLVTGLDLAFLLDISLCSG
eukprot:m.888555 g.888555  ORF g.888555 m.888555 type:complete len:94 (+) comp59933_c0_seq2:590-871(+)